MICLQYFLDLPVQRRESYLSCVPRKSSRVFLLFLQEVTLPLISLASEMICSPLTRVNGVSRCSYNKKVPCPSPGSDDRQSEERPEVFANKTLEEVCGRVLSQGARPRSLGGRGRRGRIINGTKARYGGWPWQVSLTQWNKMKGGEIANLNYNLTIYCRKLPPQVRSHPVECWLGCDSRTLCLQVR